MSSYKAIIIDDEPMLQKALQLQLKEHCPQVDVLACANSAKDGYDLITKEEPALIFLDISMPEESGFDLLDYFDTVSFEIIFVTAFNGYREKAIRQSAIDYLLKPVREEFLVPAVQRAIARIDDRKDLERYKILKENLKDFGSLNNKIKIPSTGEDKYVKVGNIIRCQGWQNCTKIFLLNGDVLGSSYSLGYYENLLLDYNFHRVHRSYLVNINEIESYKKKGALILSDRAEVPVSKKKRKAIQDLIIKHKATCL